LKLHKNWLIRTQNDELVKHISSKFNVSLVVAKIILNRGITTDENIFGFLNANETQFIDPFLISGMDIAVSRVNKALSNNEKITVYGDYDVDGITATYIMYDYLKSLGANVTYYIPDRISEGYGLNCSAIDDLKEKGTTLIITVDVGITAINEAKYASENNIDIIITDHHTPLDELPDVVAIINPKTCPDKYPNVNLAGVGVAYKFVYALSGCNHDILDKYSEAACIGTIADMVPIIGENRFIASYGLKVLSNTRNKGLTALLDVSGIDKTNITSSNVSYGIAPRINAAGRIASAETSVRLFLTEDDDEANELAVFLDESNKARQNEEQLIFDEAVEVIEKNKLYNNNFIVVSGKDWHHGVIGIVSSKITEKYYRPSAVISFDDEGTGKASGRSISGFNLFNALSHCSRHLLKYGGHELAAGFSLTYDNLQKFTESINNYADDVLTKEILTPTLNIDSELGENDLNMELINEINKLEPFGVGNKTPLFCMKSLNVKNMRIHKSGKHAFFSLRKKSLTFDAPAFNMANEVTEFSSGDCIHIAGTIGSNNYQGIDNAQFIIRDIATDSTSQIDIDNLRCVFRCLRSFINNGVFKIKLTDFSNDLKQRYNCSFGISRIIYSLEIFKEMNLITFERKYNYIVVNAGDKFNKKCNISDSSLFKKYNRSL